MLKSGLVSITFRKKSVREVCALCQRANLSAVEWGGDIHVPPKGGKAKETLLLTKDHGLEVCSYGSYFKVGQSMDDFMYNLEEAVCLSSPIIRVWAGEKASRDYTEEERKFLTDELMKISEKAYDAGVRVTLEYHPNTLTDDRNSAKRLLRDTQGEAYSPLFYWQPRWDWSEEETLSALLDLEGRLSHAHVFTWQHTETEILRKPISEGANLLLRALSIKKEGYALIEFVIGDADECLLKDAETLNNWIQGRS